MEIKKGMKKNCLTATAAALVLLFLLTLSATTAGAATTVKVDPATQDVTAGDPFSVNVSVENVTYMNADGATLNFDPTAMIVLPDGIVEGNFLKGCPGGGGTTSLEKVDNTNGTATFGYSLANSSGVGVDGNGTLATINFKTNPAAAAGVYNLNLTEVQLSDGNGTQIAVDEILNGTVTINARAAAPGLSGIGMMTLIGVLAVVLAVSVGATRKRRN